MTRLPDEDYVDVGGRTDPDEPEQSSSNSSNDDCLDSFYEKCVEQGQLLLTSIAGCRLSTSFPTSGKHVFPDLTMCVHKFADFQTVFIPRISSHALRKLYPGYSLIMSDDSRLDLPSFPEAKIERIPSSGEVKNTTSVGVPRRTGGAIRGRLVDSVVCGSYRMSWKVRSLLIRHNDAKHRSY